MLSLRLLKVNGVLLPDICSASSEGVLFWTVELSHGAEKHKTQFATPDSDSDSDSDSDPDSDFLRLQARKAPPRKAPPRRVDLMTSSKLPWEQEVEFEDKGGEDNIEVALFFETQPNKDMIPGRLLRHSIASIDLEAVRSQPEERVELLLPLRPATPREGDHRDYGAMEVAITYTDDYVGQGYLFGLFCGLTPPPWFKLLS